MYCKIDNRLYLRALIALTLTVCLSVKISAQTENGALEFPYQAIVFKDKAPVRSGPGKIHYATSQLDQNSSVEVYRHDPGGWCAIRPTSDCFSLIPASAVEILDSGVGKIQEHGTQAWIGTQLGPVDKPLWQIKLKQDELVEILGQANWPDPEGHSTTWYQIAPPAGEFRWIHISDIQQPPSLDPLVAAANQADLQPDLAFDRIPVASQSAEAVANSNDQIRFQGKLSAGVQLANFQSDQASPIPERQPIQQSAPINAINHGWKKARIIRDGSSSQNRTDRSRAGYDESAASHAPSMHRLNSGNVSPQYSGNNQSANIHSVAPPRFASSQVNPAFDLQQMDLAGNQAGRVDTAGLSSAAAGYSNSMPLTNRLSALEMDLNLELIKQPTQWELVDLRARVDSIYEGTTDPLERLQAERMLGKLDNCRKIKSGYLGVSSPTELRPSGVVGTGVATEDELALGTTYDAYGWLNELVREGGSLQSTFVLQDENGKITHHVSPTPGFNLRPYLKTKVGIIGQRGYHTALNLNHVTAERVIELKRR